MAPSAQERERGLRGADRPSMRHANCLSLDHDYQLALRNAVLRVTLVCDHWSEHASLVLLSEAQYCLLVGDRSNGALGHVSGQTTERYLGPTLSCDLRRVVRPQSAVCRLLVQVSRPANRTDSTPDPYTHGRSRVLINSPMKQTVCWGRAKQIETDIRFQVT